MLDQLAAAFDRQDYQTAARLLKQLLQQSPQNPWVQFYRARLYEVSGKAEAAESVYRQLLRENPNPKIATQSRQGLQRLEETALQQRQQAIAQATADPASAAPGFLVLEAVSGDDRTAAAQQLARIFKLDVYTARLQLPGRGWKLYRTGAIGELQVYGQELRQAQMPVFWAALPALQNIHVFQIQYFQAVSPQASVICQSSQGQLGSLTFDWSEVTQRVDGLVPIFEHVLEADVLRQKVERQRKAQTQDYIPFCDLHLPGRGVILRLSDSNYHFQKGIPFTDFATVPGLEGTVPTSLSDAGSNRFNWNHLIAFLNRQQSDTVSWADFQAFAETVVNQFPLVRRLESHIHLSRQAESDWDAAFHLYSTLAFVRSQSFS